MPVYVKTDYFSTQNSNMAYIMGFLAADGNVSKEGNRVQSQLSIKDKDQLEMFHQEIGGCEVYEYTSNGYQCCGWHCISSCLRCRSHSLRGKHPYWVFPYCARQCFRAAHQQSP